MPSRIFLAMVALVLLARAALAAERVDLHETLLGSSADYDQVKSMTVGIDSRHLAFLAGKKDKQFIVLDGKAGQSFDWIIPDSISAPLDFSRMAFVIQNGNQMSAVIDGTVGPGYYYIGADRVTFSPDAKHTAYTAKQGEG